MKKILALLLALCMVFALAACGAKTEAPAPAAEEPAAAPAEAPAEEPAAPAEEPEPASDISVAMITDYGDILQPDHLRGLQGVLRRERPGLQLLQARVRLR